MVTLGDVWLQPAISSGLIRPIPYAKSSRWWKELPEQLRELMVRDDNGFVSSHGEVYGCPYNWGATVIAVRRDLAERALGSPLSDWRDLFNPSMKGRVGMVASTREIVGGVLKSSGVGYNAGADEIRKKVFVDERTADEIQSIFSSLGDQVRLYTTNTSEGIKALSAGDLWAFVGWSSELVQFARRSSNIELIAPVSGTSLWADVMTMPSGCPDAAHVRPFFDYWCTMMIDPRFCVPSKGIAGGGACVPMLPRGDRPHLIADDDMQNAATGDVDELSAHPGALVKKKIVADATLRRSEFLHPLDAASAGIYRSLAMYDRM